MSKLEQLRNDERLLWALDCGRQLAIAQGHTPDPKVAATHIASRYQIKLSEALMLVDELLGELEDLAAEWEIEQYLEDTNRWTTNHGYTP